MGMDHFSSFARLRSLDLRAELLEAIETDGLRMVYQPKILLRSGGLCGAEALIRWNHPTLGAIPPSLFIPMAEECGLIGMIGHWTLDQCCRWLTTARLRGLRSPRLAINLSPVELLDEGLADHLLDVTHAHGVAPHQLELEITETAVISDPERATAALNTLRALGATVAIDDFGTGYSSLAYLKRLPIDVLKLDRGFVAEIDESAVDRRIVRTVVALGHTLGMTVVAEGVERQAQLDLLAKCRVDVVQGFHIARPMAGEDLLGWFEQAEPTCPSAPKA